MFTGIIEEVGTVAAITDTGDSFSVCIGCRNVSKETVPGDSVAVNGICLTVTDIEPGKHFFCDAVKETVSRTTLGTWRKGTEVNLEQALTPGSRMGGHIVQGHVDGTGSVIRTEQNRTGMEMHVSFEREYEVYLVEKGSVCIDGVSLTIAGISGTSFRTALVPFTIENTSLGSKQAGDRVNIETDILGRYVETFLTRERNGRGMSPDDILSKGFVRRSDSR